LTERGHSLALSVTGCAKDWLLLGLGQVPRHEVFQQGTPTLIEDSSCDEELGHRAILGAGPGLEGVEELCWIDQPLLEGQQSQDEIFCGIGIGAAGHRTGSRPGKAEASRAARDPLEPPPETMPKSPTDHKPARRAEEASCD
jgi:hypothetical protein